MNWSEVGRDARYAANELVRTRYRSCVSRAYYAAYSKVAHMLCEVGTSFPAGREGPSHPGQLPDGTVGDAGIRRLIMTQLVKVDERKRRALSEMIAKLYAMRLSADYHPSETLDERDAREAIQMLTTIYEAF